jgi:simple sugar transport system ATP-binding protein
VKESGVETLALSIAGFVRPSGGKVVIKGREVQSPRGFREAGGVYLTGGEPAGGGPGTSGVDLVPSPCARSLPLHDNLVIHAHRRFPHPVRLLARLGFLDRRGLGAYSQALLKDAGLRNGKALASTLSGGMLQRLLVTRELAEDAPFIMMSEPGWGLDASRRRALLAMFEREAGRGKAVLLFFSDLSDLLDVSDSVIVLHDGAVALDTACRENGTGADGLRALISGAMGGVRSGPHSSALGASGGVSGGRNGRGGKKCSPTSC